MGKIIINGKSVLDLASFHEEFSNKLDFPEYYGKNYDAFWDCLTDSIIEPTCIIWRDHLYFKESEPVAFRIIVKLLDDLNFEDKNFDYTLD